MYNDSSEPTIDDCTFSENTTDYGGGMRNSASSPPVTNSNFTDNEAYYDGGGMYNYECDSTIQNCLFANNSASDGNGGAIYCVSGSPQIQDCTFSKNTAANGYAGGLYSYNSGSSISNTIFWNNTDGDSDLDLAAVTSGTITIYYSDVTLNHYYSGTGDVDYSYCINVDPLFADAANDDFHLKSPDGRWNGSSWVTTDTVYSKCLVHSNPNYTYSNEPAPNGSKRNMGAYGNTSEASKVDPDNLADLRVQVFVFDPPDPPVAGPYNAQWKLSYEQDGTWHSPYNTGSFTLEGLVPATGYYVIFKDVSGYTTPSPFGPFELEEGELAITAGYYATE
jgi:predicted outer membrane repeat protein